MLWQFGNYNLKLNSYQYQAHWGHWWRRWRRLQPTSSIITDAKSVDSNLYNFAMQGWRRLNRGTDVIIWADVILADFQRVTSRFLQDISTYLSCTAVRVLRTIFMQNSKPKYACLPSKIVEVWIDRFCVRYDWWRRLQPTSSVSPVCHASEPNYNKTRNAKIYSTKRVYQVGLQGICLTGELGVVFCKSFFFGGGGGGIDSIVMAPHCMLIEASKIWLYFQIKPCKAKPCVYLRGYTMYDIMVLLR